MVNKSKDTCILRGEVFRLGMNIGIYSRKTWQGIWTVTGVNDNQVQFHKGQLSRIYNPTKIGRAVKFRTLLGCRECSKEMFLM